MARSSITEPLEKFRFIVSWNHFSDEENTSLDRAGFHEVQLPKRNTAKIAYREGEDADIRLLLPGISSMEDVILSRGLLSSGTDGNEFYKWVSSVHNPTKGLLPRLSLGERTNVSASHSFRKDITIKMLGRDGAVVRIWKLYQAWPTSFIPGSDLNAAEDGEKSLERITLAYEDFQEVQNNSSQPSVDISSVYEI